MTTKAKPGKWYLVEGKPFQMPFTDRLGAAIKEGDEVLYATRSTLAEGRIAILNNYDQTAIVQDSERPSVTIIRELADLVLKP